MTISHPAFINLRLPVQSNQILTEFPLSLSISLLLKLVDMSRISLVVTVLVAALLLPDCVHSANQTADSPAIEFGLGSWDGNTPLGEPCRSGSDCGNASHCCNNTNIRTAPVNPI